jgi:integrase
MYLLATIEKGAKTGYDAKYPVNQTGYIMVLSMKLTDTAVRKAKPREKPYKLTDGRGLFLLVRPNGGKLWRFKYSFGGKAKLMALGRYPDVPLVKARGRHQEARNLLASGIDPMAQRKEEKTAEKASTEGSFQTVAALWLAHWRGGQTERHAGYVERRMTADILPALGARPIGEITAPEIVKMVKAVEERGAREIAQRVLETTNQIFRYAIANDYVTNNPAAAVKPRDILKPRRKENYARVDAKELPALLRAIESYQGKNVTRLAMKLLALTFVRTSELVEASWNEFDLDAARWDIPAERMKARKPHIVPLSRQAIEILRTLRGMSDGELVFPGENNPKQPMSNNTILMAIKRMGYQGEMTGHGFRGLASTLLHEQGYNHDHIEIQLAHAPRNAVSAAYNHAFYLEPRAKMVQEWANFLEQTQRGGKVISFVA